MEITWDNALLVLLGSQTLWLLIITPANNWQSKLIFRGWFMASFIFFVYYLIPVLIETNT